MALYTQINNSKPAIIDKVVSQMCSVNFQRNINDLVLLWSLYCKWASHRRNGELFIDSVTVIHL